ncbi:hypothetical protein E2C01_005435 [Portunus trituberculatus]|uniref:Uncharacterized protein n=1 Tax=Portunus trituberculatus TaxID=210409 RepID=A0A5B7CTH5_PORTR|nr:hypothetical protein [Portunus trituberculatus]
MSPERCVAAAPNPITDKMLGSTCGNNFIIVQQPSESFSRGKYTHLLTANSSCNTVWVHPEGHN